MGYRSLFCGYDGANRFDGDIDEIRIWDVARTAHQIQNTANRELAGTETGLTHYWKFKEGSGTVSKDEKFGASLGTTFYPLTQTSDTQSLTIPTNLTATTISSTQINLTWTASTDNVGVAGYNIYRNGTKVGTTTSTAYSDTGLMSSTTYTYTISAYDAVGNTSATSTPASATTQAR
jgi:hypothetical protein